MNFFLKLLFPICLILTSCASYQKTVAPAKSLLQSEKCEEALTLLEQISRNKSGDQLAYLLEYGTALQICKDYSKSNSVLTAADNLAEEIDYTSVSQVAGSTLLNEEMVSYKGDTFEKIFINAIKALNYLQLNQLDSALVEVRKMNQKYSKFKNENKKDFELNSFAKYLSGLIWESTSHLDDACIDYKDAFFIDTKHRAVGQQMLNTCWAAERYDEFNSLAKKMNATQEEIALAKQKKSSSEVIYIYLKGWGPQKREDPQSPTFPRLYQIYNKTQYVNLKIFDSTNRLINATDSTPIYSVYEAAQAALDADRASLIARRIGARVAKEVVTHQIRQKNQELALAAWLVMVASEKADLRQWSFLPDSFHVIRVPIKEGSYISQITGLSFDKTTETEKFSPEDLIIKKNQKQIRIIRSLQ